MSSKQPPSFGSQAYWNHRFASNPDPFEWLEAPNALDPYIVDSLDATPTPKPQLLHTGCGTSLLSYHLRSHVDDPRQIHNLDYSEVAIEVGKIREQEIYHDPRPTVAYMRWDAVDLLDCKSLMRACKRATYSVVVDKSTSDSVACADDVLVPSPYPLAVRSYEPLDMDPAKSPELVHPLVVMAVNLALVTKPGARWIALSYSSDRFICLDQSAKDVIPQGAAFPHPGDLWHVVERREIDNVEWQVRNEKRDDTVTHRPKVCNFVYILERTHLPLFVRGEHV
ncbi:EEF1A lysine methyltransferase 4 [Alternaria panax]|uniref:EEF1A lysine methyltransferase 4 n=1 Tax=Alternaria panax TaxID=48097 RepID=A0AAD4FDR7_9PLEO|nr:EEF1A lysine methyltransferase 4 [Alternaria panax]